MSLLMFKVIHGLAPDYLANKVTMAGVEFRWSWGTAILALEKFELMRAPQQFQ